jgi:hypothetical protein
MFARSWTDRLGLQASLIIAAVLVLPGRVLVRAFTAVNAWESNPVRATAGASRNKLIFPIAPGC